MKLESERGHWVSYVHEAVSGDSSGGFRLSEDIL